MTTFTTQWAPGAMSTQRVSFRWVALGLAGTALVEFVLLRLFTRTAIHLPGIEHISGPYTVLAEAGRLAYFMATLFLLLLLVGWVGSNLGSRVGGRTPAALLGAGAIVAFLVAAALGRAGALDQRTLALVSLAGVVALTPWAATAYGGRRVVPVGLFAGAFVLSAAYGVGQTGGATAPGLLADSTLLVIAEGLALAFALSTVLFVSRFDRRAAIIGAAVGVVVLGSLLTNGAATKILALWSFGLAGYFPAVLYGIAAGTLTYTVVATARIGAYPAAVGLLLLSLGGIGLQSTYQTGLVVGGLALMAEGGQRMVSGAQETAPTAAGSPVERTRTPSALLEGPLNERQRIVHTTDIAHTV
jgi:hypothetical protein